MTKKSFPAIKNNHKQQNDDGPVVSRVRELAWTGQHKLAIDSASQLLPPAVGAEQ